MTTTIIAALAAIAFAAFGVQTVTGFGSMLVAVTLGAHLVDIPTLLMLFLPLSLIQCGYVGVRYRAGIDWRLLLAMILPLMGGGAAIGAATSGMFSEVMLRRGLGVLILGLVAFEVWRRRGGQQVTSLSLPASAAGLLGAGFMHGTFGTGGPLLVYTVTRRGLDKHQFRSTLTVVWLVLNIGLVGYYAIDGRYHQEHGKWLALLVGPVLLGIIAGEWLHARVDGARFLAVVFGLLAIAAITLLVR